MLAGHRVVAASYKRLFEKIDAKLNTSLSRDEALINLMPYVPLVLFALWIASRINYSHP
jgi:hypothetical protein